MINLKIFPFLYGIVAVHNDMNFTEVLHEDVNHVSRGIIGMTM